MLISAECTATQGSLPEDIGREGALLLLSEVSKGEFECKYDVCSSRAPVTLFPPLSFLLTAGGVIDSSHQSLVLVLMILCPEDVCKVFVSTSHMPLNDADKYVCMPRFVLGY